MTASCAYGSSIKAVWFDSGTCVRYFSEYRLRRYNNGTITETSSSIPPFRTLFFPKVGYSGTPFRYFGKVAEIGTITEKRSFIRYGVLLSSRFVGRRALFAEGNEAIGRCDPPVTERILHFDGSPLMQYVDGIRMTKAKQLLLGTDLKIKDIVEQVGLTDPNNFFRKFKKREGVTPLEYRGARGSRETGAERSARRCAGRRRSIRAALPCGRSGRTKRMVDLPRAD